MLQTKEFRTATIGLLLSMLLYFGGKYLEPSAFEDLKFVADTITPYVLLLVGYFFVKGNPQLFRR